MKLAVSTLGCPDWTLPQILSRIKAYGYDGVELRGLGPDLDLTQSPAFATPAAAATTRRAFADAGLEICALDTSASFADAIQVPRAAAEARTAIDLAQSLAVPFVRVFGGAVPEGVSRTDAVASVAEQLILLGEYAQNNGDVTLVLETHDTFSTGAQVAEVLGQVGHSRAAALWDLHHPYRQGESPEQTGALLAPYTRHTHVKDSRPPDSYCLLGEGDIPILPMLRLLEAQGYDGWISLEWEKRWHPELDDPAIAFPQYAAKLRDYLSHL